MIIVGQAALARPDGAAVLAAAWRLAASVGALTAGVARLQRAAHRRRARRRAGSGLRARRQRQVAGADAGRRRRCAVAARRRRVRHGADRRRYVRGLSGPSRRCRRRAGRRDPAGRCLHREIRHLRQHRGPRAARLPGGLSAGRGARGLEDPARVQRDGRPHAALRHDRCTARSAGAGEPGIRPRRLPAALRLHRSERPGRRSRRAVR